MDKRSIKNMNSKVFPAIDSSAWKRIKCIHIISYGGSIFICAIHRCCRKRDAVKNTGFKYDDFNN